MVLGKGSFGKVSGPRPSRGGGGFCGGRGAGRSKSPRGLRGSPLDAPWFRHIFRGFPLQRIKIDLSKSQIGPPVPPFQGSGWSRRPTMVAE